MRRNCRNVCIGGTASLLINTIGGTGNVIMYWNDIQSSNPFLVSPTNNSFFNVVEVPTTFTSGRSSFKIFGSQYLKLDVPLKMEIHNLLPFYFLSTLGKLVQLQDNLL